MASPRPILVLALLGVALAGVTLMATRNAREATSDSAPVSSTRAQRPAQPKQAAPQPARSGRFRLRFAMSERGPGAAETTSFQARGRFQSAGRSAVPKFQVELSGRDDKQSFRAGAISLGDRGFLLSRGRFVAIPAKGWSQVVAARQRLAGLATRTQPQRRSRPSVLGLRAENLLRGARRSSSVTVDGVRTNRLSGAVNAGAVLDAMGKVAGQRGGAAVPKLPPQATRQLASMVRDSRVDLYVGARDGILRRFRARVDLRLPPAQRRPGQADQARITAAFDLSDVGQPQTFRAPARTRQVASRDSRGAGAVFGTLALGTAVAAVDLPGLDGAQARGGIGNVLARPAPRGLPRGVARALAARRTVVLFFSQGGSADDEAVADAVGSLRREVRKASVFSARLNELSRYRRVLGQGVVTRSPSVVIIAPNRRASVIEGYVDARSLIQETKDAAR